MEPKVSQKLPEGVNPDFVKPVDGILYDLCVICKNISGVLTNCPIDQRKYYVEGCGQLCEKCWHETDGSC